MRAESEGFVEGSGRRSLGSYKELSQKRGQKGWRRAYLESALFWSYEWEGLVNGACLGLARVVAGDGRCLVFRHAE